MKYLKKFENHSEYETYIQGGGVALPNVSLCEQENGVYYNALVPMIDGHEYVDLGLPSGTKWATMNVGANSITDYGNYYQYGKGVGTYQATSGDSTYNGSENPLSSLVDTATQSWGENWHTPTKTQLEELISYTEVEYVTNYNNSGINGFVFTNNNQSLFIPAAGSYYDGTLSNNAYWSFVGCSSPIPGDTSNGGTYMLVLSPSVKSIQTTGRIRGLSIRPVAD